MGIEIDGFDFGCNLPLDRETLWMLNRATPEMLFSLEAASRREATKLWVNGLGKNLSSLTKVLNQEFGDSISIFPNANFNFLDMPSNRTSKAIGIQYLLNSQRISLTDVVAIGDDNPDLPLLEVCGIPIAMANASPEILACTLFRTASNDEDGVAIVLEQVLANYTNC